MNFHFRPSALALLVVLAATSAWGQTRNLLSCSTLPQLMERFGNLHVSQNKPAPDLTRRAADLYLKRYDPAKALLTAAEAADLEARVLRFYEQAKEGRCDLLKPHLAEQVAHHAAMQAFVQKQVDDPAFALDRGIELLMDADKRERPKDKAAQATLRRQLVHFQVASYVASGTALDEAKKKLTKRYSLISKRISEIDEAELLTTLLDAYANAFDPHTTYFSADALEDFRIGMQLSLEGIGAVLRSRDGYTLVYEVVKGGAAERQGQLKPKDRIIAVSQGAQEEPVDVVDMALSDVVRLIRGKKGTEVRLTVLRQGEKTETLNITIVRDTIDLKEQAAKVRYEQVQRGGRSLKLAVLTLPSFYGSSTPGGRQCADDVATLLEEVKQANVDGLVLDLAENSGGLLQHAVDITGFFLRRGAVVGIEGTEGESKQLNDVDQRLQYAGPLVVLTSRLSASASEILAGAVKDYRRGLIVGDDHTFGKGTVQNVVNLPEGLGALKVTTALFFRPGGESTQQTGVTADIIVPSPFNTDQFGEKNHDYSLAPQRTTPFKSESVNVEGPEGWRPVTDAVIADLAVKSKRRIDASEDFKKVAQDLKKAQEREGLIKVADILDDKDRKSEDEDEAPKPEDDTLSPQAKEGLEVLADLIEAGGIYARPEQQKPSSIH